MHRTEFIFSVVICTVFLSICSQAALLRGDQCTVDYEPGECTLVNDCDFAKEKIKQGKHPLVCSFEKNIPVVCCPTTFPDVKTNIGNVSIEMCKRYISPPPVVSLIIVGGGVETRPREFPHMALLGYSNGTNISWLCGGSLISHQFVLTAAHCINAKIYGKVQVVRLGELDHNTNHDEAKPQDYFINETFIHPEYKRTSYYHDIALIKLDKNVVISEYIKPACLHTQSSSPKKLIVTGWGKTSFTDDLSSHLLKADLQLVEYKECAKFYENAISKKLDKGIVNEYQVCAGDQYGKDACPGDSGGPLQEIKEYGGKRFYSIVGVTSFGKACAIERTVGVYTRVAPYVKWIENIVWN